MYESIKTPRWKQFHESLARVLKVSLGVVTSEGDFLSIHNPGPVFLHLSCNALLRATYRDFRRSVLITGCTENRILTDPLGLMAAVIPVGNGTNLVMWGGLDGERFRSRLEFETALAALGIDGEDCAGVPTVSRAELDEKIDALMTLYGHIYRWLEGTEDLGDRVILLAAAEEIDKLLVNTLNPVNFDLSAVLDLAASSLIILLDAEGSCIFTRDRRDETVAVIRGQRQDFLEDLKTQWSACVNVGRPEEAVDVCARPAAAAEVKLETSSLQKEANSMLLGVVNPARPSRAALSVFTRQVAIAMEMASLYRALQEQMGILLNSVQHGIIVTNRQREVMLVNRAAADSLNALGIDLAPGQSLVGAGLGRSIEEALSLAIRGSSPSMHQQSSLADGDSVLHLRWGTSPVRWDDEALGAVLLFEDVTELVTLRHRMYHRDKLVTAGEVAAGLAHEIRNPLATARAAVQLVQTTADQEKAGELYTLISAELDRINSSLTSFLDFSRPAGTEDLKVVDLGEVVQEVEFMIAAEAYLYGIQIRNRVGSGELPPVLGEVNRLKQVFLNICKNAMEVIEDGGQIEIFTHLDGKYAWVGFRDNGPGIPDEDLENLVRPFFTTKLTGTGLGLSISSAIVRELGGELRIESQPGRGTTVYVGLLRYSSQGALPMARRRTRPREGRDS